MSTRHGIGAGWVVVLSAVGVLIGIGVAFLVGAGGAESDSDDPDVTSFNFRADAKGSNGAPPAERVLEVAGLSLSVACWTVSGSPVVQVIARSEYPRASLAIDYTTRNGERYPQVLTNFSRFVDSTSDLLGSIPAGDARVGTLTYAPPHSEAVTVTFLAMNGAPGVDCVLAGTAQH